jgi:hypothetical protein
MACLFFFFIIASFSNAYAYGTLVIESSPPGSKILINGGFYGRTPLSLALESGYYRVELKKEGYEALKREVLVRDGKTLHLRPELVVRKAYGKLDIASTPPQARLHINGKYIQMTPAVVQLESGIKNIKIKKKGYVPYRGEIKIKENESVRLHVRLKKKDLYGTLVVESQPHWARLYVKDLYYDLTPARIELPEGNHKIRLKKRGFQPFFKDVFVSGGRETKIFAVLDPLDRHGTLDIASTPSRAVLFIDGSYYDRTPLKVRLVPGRHTIKLTKRGYYPYVDEVDIRGGIVTRRDIQLSKRVAPRPRHRRGILRIFSSPQGGTVKIQGKKYGKTPLEIELGVGTYDVSIKKKGYEPHLEKIQIRKRQMSYIRIQLKKIAPPSPFGTLNLTSIPERSKIFIDGKYLGIAPLSVRLPAGQHWLKVRKRGFEVYKERVHIQPGGQHRVEAALVRKETPSPKLPFGVPYPKGLVSLVGIVEIVSRPLNSIVFIDGKYYGRTPITMKMHPGGYSLEVRHRGYSSYRQKIFLHPKDRMRIQADLRWLGHGKD